MIIFKLFFHIDQGFFLTTRLSSIGSRDLEINLPRINMFYAYCILLTDDEQAHLYFFIDLMLTQYISHVVRLLFTDKAGI